AVDSAASWERRAEPFTLARRCSTRGRVELRAGRPRSPFSSTSFGPYRSSWKCNGVRALARFTVRSERTLEMPTCLALRTLKRRERRAPHAAHSLVTHYPETHYHEHRVRFVFLFAALARQRASSVHAAWSDSLLCNSPFVRRFRPGAIADPLCRHERK